MLDDPWLVEPVAGIIEPGEDAPAEVARREATEEAGLELLDLVPACTYFASPSGSTETCQVFIGRVEAAGPAGSSAAPMRARTSGCTSFRSQRGRWHDGRIHAVTTVVALQWLALHRPGWNSAGRGGGVPDERLR